jgi:hypothetical protein
MPTLARWPRRFAALTHRLLFLAALPVAGVFGWLAGVLWVAACYVDVSWFVSHNFAWVLAWVSGALPRRTQAIPRPTSFEWDTWGPGAYWTVGAPAPQSWWEVLELSSERVLDWHGVYIGYDTYYWFPIWAVFGLWTVAAVMLARSLWRRHGPVGMDGVTPTARLAFSGLDLRAFVLSGVATLPLMGLWRIERHLWEAAVLWGPVGRSSSVEPYHGAHLLLLAQVILLHWLIVWAIYRRCLRREVRLGRAHAKPGVTRCLACGYERGDAPRCPECGAGDGHPGQPKARAPLRCFEWTGWKRRLLSTPAMVAVMVVLFFSPAWLPFVT